MENGSQDYLFGTEQLLVLLPDGTTFNYTAAKSCPMMDLLIQIASRAKLKPSAYVLQPLADVDPSVPSTIPFDAPSLPYKPNTRIGMLDTRVIRLAPKQIEYQQTKSPKSSKPFGFFRSQKSMEVSSTPSYSSDFKNRVKSFNDMTGTSAVEICNNPTALSKLSQDTGTQVKSKCNYIASTLPPVVSNQPNNGLDRPFEATFRLQVHLPYGQLHVLRASSSMLLRDVFDIVCDERNLKMERYNLKKTGDFTQDLNLDRTLKHYGITELTMELKPDYQNKTIYRTVQREEERKAPSVTRIITSLFKKNSKPKPTYATTTHSGLSSRRSSSVYDTTDSVHYAESLPEAYNTKTISGHVINNTSYSQSVVDSSNLRVRPMSTIDLHEDRDIRQHVLRPYDSQIDVRQLSDDISKPKLPARKRRKAPAPPGISAGQKSENTEGFSSVPGRSHTASESSGGDDSSSVQSGVGAYSAPATLPRRSKLGAVSASAADLSAAGVLPREGALLRGVSDMELHTGRPRALPRRKKAAPVPPPRSSQEDLRASALLEAEQHEVELASIEEDTVPNTIDEQTETHPEVMTSQVPSLPSIGETKTEDVSIELTDKNDSPTPNIQMDTVEIISEKLYGNEVPPPNVDMNPVDSASGVIGRVDGQSVNEVQQTEDTKKGIESPDVVENGSPKSDEDQPVYVETQKQVIENIDTVAIKVEDCVTIQKEESAMTIEEITEELPLATKSTRRAEKIEDANRDQENVPEILHKIEFVQEPLPFKFIITDIDISEEKTEISQNEKAESKVDDWSPQLPSHTSKPIYVDEDESERSNIEIVDQIFRDILSSQPDSLEDIPKESEDIKLKELNMTNETLVHTNNSDVNSNDDIIIVKENVAINKNEHVYNTSKQLGLDKDKSPNSVKDNMKVQTNEENKKDTLSSKTPSEAVVTSKVNTDTAIKEKVVTQRVYTPPKFMLTTWKDDKRPSVSMKTVVDNTEAEPYEYFKPTDNTPKSKYTVKPFESSTSQKGEFVSVSHTSGLVRPSDFKQELQTFNKSPRESIIRTPIEDVVKAKSSKPQNNNPEQDSHALLAHTISSLKPLSANKANVNISTSTLPRPFRNNQEPGDNEVNRKFTSNEVQRSGLKINSVNEQPKAAGRTVIAQSVAPPPPPMQKQPSIPSPALATSPLDSKAAVLTELLSKFKNGNPFEDRKQSEKHEIPTHHSAKINQNGSDKTINNSEGDFKKPLNKNSVSIVGAQFKVPFNGISSPATVVRRNSSLKLNMRDINIVVPKMNVNLYKKPTVANGTPQNNKDEKKKSPLKDINCNIAANTNGKAYDNSTPSWVLVKDVTNNLQKNDEVVNRINLIHDMLTDTDRKKYIPQNSNYPISPPLMDEEYADYETTEAYSPNGLPRNPVSSFSPKFTMSSWEDDKRDSEGVIGAIKHAVSPAVKVINGEKETVKIPNVGIRMQ